MPATHEASGERSSSAQFITALDASIAHGDLQTDRQDLTLLLGRPPTPLTDVVRAAHSALADVSPHLHSSDQHPTRDSQGV
jgi:hypothetical protein